MPLSLDSCHTATRNRDVFVRTLHEACLMLGGEHALAVHLGASLDEVNRWLEGRERPPDHIFLRCVDLVQRNESELKPPADD